MEYEKPSPKEATIKAMEQVSSAIVASTLVLLAIFVPVGFLGGITGKIYQQFAIAISTSVAFSALNALTLSPALCALLLKPAGEGKKKSTWLRKFFVVFNRGYNRFERRYHLGLHKYLSRKSLTYITLVLFFLATYGINFVLPTGFIPNED